MTILEMNHISKAFGPTRAVTDVTFAVNKGEIHALLGENGAGKSTLMNILAGVFPADTGTITFCDHPYPHPTIKTMERAGISFVHQELNVVNDLTVSENIFLNRELISPLRLLRKKDMEARTQQLFEELGVDIDPTVMVSTLKTGQKQLLEICRALYTDAKLLILDEPTTALNNDEIARLFTILRSLKEKGTSFIFISHKMPEIFEISDSYTVMRNGAKVSSGHIADVTPHQITVDMVGTQYADRDVYAQRSLGEPVLELCQLSGKGFRNVSLAVHKGEVVAFTGLAGSGASELMQAMFGVLPADSGQILVHGQPVRGSIRKFMKNNLGMLPTNRKENSAVPDMTVLENTYLAEQVLSGSKPFIHKKNEIERYHRLKELLGIRAQDHGDAITSLSGGNQQKVFIARWLNTNAEILLLDNPTQGVDVGAKEEIYSLILGFAKDGKTVLINTLEIAEITKVSDRCVVFYDGQVVNIFDHDSINEHDVMLYSTNAINATEEHAG